jgi:predicted DNA-binding transcriptional regulator AlpA
MAKLKVTPTPDQKAKFWRIDAVMAYTQRSRSSIYSDKCFPKPVKLGANTSAWIAAEVIAWGNSRISMRDAESDGADQ